MLRSKKLFIAALFLFSGCSSSSSWELSAIASEQKQFDSARLRYLPENQFTEMNLELIYSNGGITGYLVGDRQFTNDETKALISIGSEKLSVPLAMHAGRMRARLPDEITLKVVCALQKNQALTINVGALQQQIEPEKFSDRFNQLIHKKNISLNAFQGFLP
jgi:hypothetical protein